ncbi:hydroxyethylthiazole kinase [Kallotenue papyrolyticum]|uniref:hydroxyethylthiazole kinase n=1 Tax=Kallotenue papyrolyticum TaxID=1325125 RepID=UPI0004785E99|nr:hydroxyethylthiazole kinase [Kallotenue papyrolyticum]
MNELSQRAGAALARLREQRPLIHHITNLVVMNDTANLTLHLGALPVMAHAAEEVADMVALADALVLNIGTLTPAWIESMLLAGQAANQRGIPVVFDPVGAGATPLRTDTSRRLLAALRIAVVRGNPGEIGTLAGLGGEVRGVESVGSGADPVRLAQHLARAANTVVAVTGARDIIADGARVLAVDNGHAWLASLTGTGCMATTAIAAFAAVEDDALIAAASALAAYGVAAELAAQEARGPASFKVALFDQLHALTPELVAHRARIAWLSAEEAADAHR